MKMKLQPKHCPARGGSSGFCRCRGNKLKLGLQRGFLMVDLMVGLAILTIAVVPLGYSFARERQVLRIEYFHSVINELVDGEMEILAAGAAKDLPDGSQVYPVQSHAAANLPPGHFQLTKTGSHLRLEWLPDDKHGLSPVVRETTLK
jgi:hypothetical protein